MDDGIIRKGMVDQTAMIAVIVQQMLWSTGIHGASLVGAVMGPTWFDQNRIAFQAGQEPPMWLLRNLWRF
jgi:cellobiose-specific phosphotransferase system component IIC